MSKNRDVATYDVGHLNIDSILHWLKRDEIDIPELQRPFVWTPKKIWEFIEALYRGHPIGYFVTYDKPSMPLKGGKKAKSGSKIIIDGQQRIKALQSVVLQGKPIINENTGKIKLMYPQDARLRDLTYNSAISIDIKHKFITYKPEKGQIHEEGHNLIKKVYIGKIPIMLHSNFCTLNELTNNYNLIPFNGRFKNITSTKFFSIKPKNLMYTYIHSNLNHLSNPYTQEMIYIELTHHYP